MSKDYVHLSKRKKQPKKEKSRRGLRWAFIALVLLLALLIVGIVYIQRHVNRRNQPPGVTSAARTVPIVDLTKQKNLFTQTGKIQPSKKPIKFEFYNMLPDMNVSVNNAQPAPQEKQQRYLLQLASVTDAKAAANFRKDMHQKGFKTAILTVKRGNQTWYRIQMGPFKNEEAAEEIRNKLQVLDISSILIPAR